MSFERQVLMATDKLQSKLEESFKPTALLNNLWAICPFIEFCSSLEKSSLLLVNGICLLHIMSDFGLQTTNIHLIVHVEHCLPEHHVFVRGSAIDCVDGSSEVQEGFDVLDFKRREAVYAVEIGCAARHEDD